MFKVHRHKSTFEVVDEKPITHQLSGWPIVAKSRSKLATVSMQQPGEHFLNKMPVSVTMTGYVISRKPSLEVTATILSSVVTVSSSRGLIINYAFPEGLQIITNCTVGLAGKKHSQNTRY